MAKSQNTNKTTPAQAKYEPDKQNNTVAERILAYIDHSEQYARASEVADKIESTTDYTRRVANDLVDEDRLAKEKGSEIIGHPMPPNGKVAVLVADVEVLRSIVDRYGTVGQYQQALGMTSVEELRNFIKENIAIGSGYGLGTYKVSFGPLDD